MLRLHAHLGITVAVRVQADLSNESVVWHHHCTWAEKSLEVVWKLTSSSIPRVHGNEDCARRVEGNLTVFKDETLHVGHDGKLYGKDLLCNNR